MKRSIVAIMTILFAFSIYAKDIKELVVTATPPMSCQNCENKIKGNLRFEKGVKKIETNLADQRVIVEYDAEKTNPTQIEEAFKKIGYNVEVINEENGHCGKHTSTATESHCGGTCCQSKEQK